MLTRPPSGAAALLQFQPGLSFLKKARVQSVLKCRPREGDLRFTRRIRENAATVAHYARPST